MSKHAILSASSAERWIHCPPSAKINAESERRDTPYSLVGTLAHSLAEIKARNFFLPHTMTEPFAECVAALKTEHEELVSQYGEDAVGAWREVDRATNAYLDTLKDLAADYAEPPHIALEVRVDYSAWAPEGFGTSDCVMIGGDTITVVDYKNGRGVPVSAQNNPQMRLYALGALMAYAPIYDIKQIRMVIVQPHCRDEPDREDMPLEALDHWAADVVMPAAQLAFKGEGEMREGEWCRFCATKANCRGRADAFTAFADKTDRPSYHLDDEEIAAVLEIAPRIAAWVEDVKSYALARCLDGGDIPGYKAVAGRSTRAWSDQRAAFDAAIAGGVPEEMLYERKPLTLAAVEKCIGKAQFQTLLGDYVVSPPGKPTLAPVTDKREAITNTDSAAEFAAMKYEED